MRAMLVKGALVVCGTQALLSGRAAGQSIGGQVRIDPTGGTFASNETTASASEFDPNRIIAGWNDWRRSTGGNEIINAGFTLSTDGGQTWTDFLIRPPLANQSTVEGDPMTTYDDRTGTLWAGAISFTGNGGIYVARLDPGSNVFNASVMARRSGGTDKCWMAAGIKPGDPNSTRVYIAYNEGVIRSDDLGTTWTNPLNLGSGIGFLPRVGPAGEVYICYWDIGNGMMLKRSFNGGDSFDTVRIATRLDVWGVQDGSRNPSNFRIPAFCYIAVNPSNGTVYCVYFDTTNRAGADYNLDLYFTKSTQQGAAGSWSAPRVINTDGGNPNADQIFPWLECDNAGRLHVVFFDTRHTNNQHDTDVNGFYDTYYMVSVDDGATWSEHRLAPQTWNANNDGLNRGQQFIGDYNGMAQAGSKVYPAYLDTHTGDPDIYTNVIDFHCAADFNGDGDLDVFDFLEFQTAFSDLDPEADLAPPFGSWDVFDFLEFQTLFSEGC